MYFQIDTRYQKLEHGTPYMADVCILGEPHMYNIHTSHLVHPFFIMGRHSSPSGKRDGFLKPAFGTDKVQ